MSEAKTFTPFWMRHERKNFTPVFNQLLDAQMLDDTLPLEMRVLAWVLRYSWGNHSDTCVEKSSGGNELKQVDCARLIGVDKRRIQPVFAFLKAQNLIRFEGQGIFPIDNPRENPSEEGSKVHPLSDFHEEKANTLDFSTFLDAVIANEEPDEYRAYQKAADEVKSYRTKWLERYKAFKNSESERGRTFEKTSPQGDGPLVRKGEDFSSERGGLSDDASLYGLKRLNVKGASSSFSVLREAFELYAQTDDDQFQNLLNETRKATPEELVDITHTKGKLIPERTKNRGAYLSRSIINAVESTDFQTLRRKKPQKQEAPEALPVEAQIEYLERSLKEFPNHQQARAWREQLEQLRPALAQTAGAR